MEHLALQVGPVDHVEIDDAERTDTGGRQVERGRRAEPARAHEQHPCCLQFALALDSHVGKNEVPRVAQDLIVRQFGQLLGHDRALLPTAGNARHNGHDILRTDGRLLASELADIPVVHVHVDKAA